MRIRCIPGSGASIEKWPWASVLLFAISCMRWSSEIRVTVSPAEGVCVVPLVTVPVMVVAADAPAAKANKAQSALKVGLILIFQAAGKLDFVSGHDFSRAATPLKVSRAFSPCRRARDATPTVQSPPAPPRSHSPAPRVGRHNLLPYTCPRYIQNSNHEDFRTA